MNRFALLAAGAGAAAALLAAPATASAATTTTTTTCGSSGLQSGLMTQVCAEVTGDSVQFYGRISLAGPPSPGSPAPQPRELYTTLSGNVVGGASLGTHNQGVIFTASTVYVNGVGGTVPCGSTVHASFSVASYPWNPNPVTVDVPVNC